MKYLSRIKKRVLKALNNQFSFVVYSILIAIVLWFIIAVTKYPSMSKTIENIPLSTELSKDMGDLSLISCDVESVNVQIDGNRLEIGNIDKDNLTAKLVTTNINTSGTKTVAIRIECENDDIEFEVKSIEPSTAVIVLDKIETREFAVSPEIPNITFAEGKTINQEDFSCEPSVINISGPSAQLDQIAQCRAVSNRQAVLDSSYKIQSDEIKLYAENGAVIENPNLKVEDTNISINIPVLTQNTLDLSLSIINAPSNFDKDFLEFSMSAENITLATSTSPASFPENFEMGQIKLSDIDIGYSTTFTIDTKDYINQSNLEAVTVTLENDNLAKKEVILNNLTISNPSSDYDYTVIAQSITVTIIGPEDIIDNITSNDLVADVNLLNETSNSDSFTHDVTISCPDYNNVWAFGTYKVTVNRTPKTQSTTTQTTTANISD